MQPYLDNNYKLFNKMPAPSGHSSSKSKHQSSSAASKPKSGAPEFKTQEEMKQYVENTRQQLEKEIHKRLVEQLVLKVQHKTLPPDQQELLERLYIDLKMINPELAFMTLKASGLVKSPADQKNKSTSNSSKPSSSSKSHSKRSHSKPANSKPSNPSYY